MYAVIEYTYLCLKKGLVHQIHLPLGPVALDFLQQQLSFGVDFVSQLHDCLQLH